MAIAVPTQTAGAPASQGFTQRAAAGSAAQAHGLLRPGGAAGPHGVSPAAQALAPKKPSAFLRLFRRIAGAAGQKAPGEIQSGREGGSATETSSARARKKAGEAAELRAEAQAARAGRKPRRGGGARQGGQQAPDASLEAALPGPAPARRPHGVAPQEAAAPAVEARREPRPAQARVFVVDLRTRSAESGERPELRRAFAAPERGEAQHSFERVLLAREAGNAAESPRSSSSLTGPALPRSAQERLVPEIVHQAGIILRDGGEGEIRLVLKPEHLGSVRIRLHLGESSLEGRIVVDNSNVKELLDANLEQLKSALRQEGFASANIDVTVSGGGGERRELEPDPGLPAVAGRKAEEFERATPAVLDLGFTTVNLFV